MNMARAEADHRHASRGLDAAPRGARPGAAAGQHAKHGGFVQAEALVAADDAHGGFRGGEGVALFERPQLTLELGLTQQLTNLFDAAQDAFIAREDLHRHDGVEAFGLEDLVGAAEVDVSRVAVQDVPRDVEGRLAHGRQLTCSPGWTLSAWAALPSRSAIS